MTEDAEEGVRGRVASSMLVLKCNWPCSQLELRSQLQLGSKPKDDCKLGITGVLQETAR